ncbi:Geranylgeranyl transferase type-2 subunit beta 1 [Dictyocoela muelleri]|nr:Geranylgeranyl transferase type-2 subunit beta 1 [Dictyocoela muelleri]
MTTFNYNELILYLINTFSKKDYLYQTNPSLRLSSMYWTVLSLKILEGFEMYMYDKNKKPEKEINNVENKKSEVNDENKNINQPAFDIKIEKEKIFKEVYEFLLKCKNTDGGYAANIGYPSTLFTTYVALQLRYLLKKQEYDQNTMNFIKKCYKNGMFFNDNYDEEDNRFLCCGLSSLYFLYLSKKKSNKKPDKHFFNNHLNKCYQNQGNYKLNGIYTFDNQEKIIYISYIESSRISDYCSDNEFIIFLEKEGFNPKEITSYIFKCYNRDGGFGSKPGNESHAGQIYCCTVSLSLLKMLNLLDFHKLSKFIVFRHNSGLNGRPNKKDDVCYSFWALSIFKILNIPIDKGRLEKFIFDCFNQNGFAYRPGNDVDLYHTCYALMGLSLLEVKGFRRVIPELGVVID